MVNKYFFIRSDSRNSSYINHFIQPDTIIPDPANPQAFNRYRYTGNNPINFNDPTGHKECDYKCQIMYEGADPFYEHYGESLSCWGPEDCYGIRPNSVVAKAFKGDPGAILDSVLPTDYGLRVQGEIVTSNDDLPFFVPSSVTVGLQVTYNRNDGNLVLSEDISPEAGLTFSPESPVGASVTDGLVLGWFSNVNQSAGNGTSTVLSGTIAGGEAVSVATNTQLHVDPKYGTFPVSHYVGGGKGAGYVSGGGGVTYSIQIASANLNQLIDRLLGW